MMMLSRDNDMVCVNCITLGNEVPGDNKWAVGLLVQDANTQDTFVRPLVGGVYLLSDTWIPFDCSEWPPTDDDLRRAEVVALMNRGRKYD